jgi:hypothetical protein
MARGNKTGGRQKGTPNKRKAEYDAKFAEAAGQITHSRTDNRRPVTFGYRFHVAAGRHAVRNGA